MKVKFRNWPWQTREPFWANPDGKTGTKWGWNPMADGGMGRFGGGWKWKLGIACGGREIILDLILGSIRISFIKEKQP